MGTLAGTATLELMIPPSLTLIVYGVTVNESITQLFMAGILPGLVLASMFSLYIVGWYLLKKDQRPTPEPELCFKEKLWNSRFLVPVILLVLTVIGSIVHMMIVASADQLANPTMSKNLKLSTLS